MNIAAEVADALAAVRPNCWDCIKSKQATGAACIQHRALREGADIAMRVIQNAARADVADWLS